VSALFFALVNRRWALWYGLLPIAILNKEATALVVVWLVAGLPSTRKTHAWRHMLASTGIAAAVVACLWWYFRDRPGFVAQPNLAHNLRYWASLRWLVATQDAFGTALPLPVAFNAINVAAVWLVWSCGKRYVAPEVARAFVLSCIAVLPLLVTSGFENEIRTCGIAAPPFVVLASAAVGRLYDRPVENH
jgi:predicted secreted protein